MWEDATTKFGFNKRRTYLLGKGLDSVMNYPFKNAVLDFVKGLSLIHILQMTTRGRENMLLPQAFFRKFSSILAVMSKSAMTPSFRGRTATMLPAEKVNLYQQVMNQIEQFFKHK